MAMTHLKRKEDGGKLFSTLFPIIRKPATVSSEERFNNLDW